MLEVCVIGHGHRLSKGNDKNTSRKGWQEGGTWVRPWPRWEGGGRYAIAPRPAAALLRRVTAESTAREKAWLKPLMLVRVQPAIWRQTRVAMGRESGGGSNTW